MFRALFEATFVTGENKLFFAFVFWYRVIIYKSLAYTKRSYFHHEHGIFYCIVPFILVDRREVNFFMVFVSSSMNV